MNDNFHVIKWEFKGNLVEYLNKVVEILIYDNSEP